MQRFHVVDEAAVILRSRGVYRQAKVFLRGEGVYAAHGGGFVRLYKGGGTSVPALSWDDVEIGNGGAETLTDDAQGRLTIVAATFTRHLEVGK